MRYEGSVSRWILNAKNGDEAAAQQLWERYYSRLVRHARRKLQDMPRRVADEEDVVLNAFESFYRAAEENRFPQLEDRNDLIQILLMLTSRKAINEKERQRATKRGGGAVRGYSVAAANDNDIDLEAMGIAFGREMEPTPEYAAIFADELAQRLGQLGDETLIEIAIAKMEGFSVKELAGKFECSERTINRKLALIRKKWSTEP